MAINKTPIFVAKTRNYDIFVTKIYDYALIDSFWGFPRFIDSPTSYATLVTVNGTRWALSMGGLMGKITINLRHEFERKLTKGRLLLRSLLELKPNFRVNHPLQANILYSNKLRQISRMQFFILTSATLQSKQSDSIYQLFIGNIFSSFKVDNSNY